MAIFRRKRSETEGGEAVKKEKGSWRRPANTAFKQQRLKAWQPIFTPKTVLPIFFVIGVIFAPIGALLIWGSGLVSEITIDYSDCETLTPASTVEGLQFSPINDYTYSLRAGSGDAPVNQPQFALLNNSINNPAFNATQAVQCYIRFDIPIDLEPPVFLYYKLTNFYQNHRRYVKSLSTDQLKGKFVSVSTLNSGDCKPLSSLDDKAYYPCGLIANSVFNDTYSPLNSTTGSSPYFFSEKGIAWPGESKKYTDTPPYDFDAMVPPPGWQKLYPNNYTADNFPNLKGDEHFQNWMRTAGLPTFSKLWGRNDNDKLPKGSYQIAAADNFPVLPYKGKKAFVISTVSWIGGKNPFLGWAYVATASLFVLLAILGTIRHMIKPRKTGDMSQLSWNQ